MSEQEIKRLKDALGFASADFATMPYDNGDDRMERHILASIERIRQAIYPGAEAPTRELDWRTKFDLRQRSVN